MRNVGKTEQLEEADMEVAEEEESPREVMQDECNAPINKEDRDTRESGISTNMDHKDKLATIIIADQATTDIVTVPQEGSAATATQGILIDFQDGTEHRDDMDPQDATQEEE